MMKQYYHKTSAGIELPVEVGVFKVSLDTLKQFYHPEARDSWCCTTPIKCSQFGCRPCCPPRFPKFFDLPQRKNLYIIITRMATQDYLDAYPKVANTSMRFYGTSTGVHYLTRGALYRIVKALYQKGDQGFKVGGCSGCTVKKTGKCNKILMPALEGTGIDVIHLYKHITGIDMEWNKPKELMGHMAAVGGLYTDRDIKPSEIWGVVEGLI